jgi:hypothetical protein
MHLHPTTDIEPPQQLRESGGSQNLKAFPTLILELIQYQDPRNNNGSVYQNHKRDNNITQQSL